MVVMFEDESEIATDEEVEAEQAMLEEMQATDEYVATEDEVAAEQAMLEASFGLVSQDDAVDADDRDSDLDSDDL